MNCPSRTDPEVPNDWNQSPNDLASDTTTRSDLGKLASARVKHDHKLKNQDGAVVELRQVAEPSHVEGATMRRRRSDGASSIAHPGFGEQMLEETLGQTVRGYSRTPNPKLPSWQQPFRRSWQVLWKFVKFIGPGFMVAVAYIDPGNYATDAAAGATYRFKLLFMVLLSNIFAILLQSLCIKMSTVTGLNLAEMNKAHCSSWLNYVLWFFGEAAVIATDIAEVIGFAIALNLLAPKLPLVAGCAISILDVMFILLFYRPEGSMKALRVFECFVIALVLGVAVCFCYQLSLIKNATPGEVFKGYLPSSAIVQGRGLYQACGILGATVMPHSLYLGSGLNQPRLRQFDMKHNYSRTHQDDDDEDAQPSHKYRPSLQAINSCMKYSIIELAISLFTFALFINSAILIVCGASLYSIAGSQDADLFGIYGLLNDQLGHAAATMFAVALLLSGCSAGIVCTMAGQMISEGQINWKLRPWLTRLITRSISIVPAILVAGTIGKDGLSKALVGSQVALSIILPFVSAPLIYYTCRNKYMTVVTSPDHLDGSGNQEPEVKMRNHWILSAIAIAIWILIVIMNVANIVLTGLGFN
ncbi:Manganese transporter SMF2 [Lecanosticta acicola]|uniref:Manganese transporter SMF2 n=1 Tax=Lecanosticta acicola TaxID=111012 RepID=A0AAI9EAH1_9PEZI|nr:Manganese transporter SMF2 [Lecanosticta acicola]